MIAAREWRTGWPRWPGVLKLRMMNIWTVLIVAFGVVGSYCAVSSWSALRRRHFPVAIVAGSASFVFLSLTVLLLVVWLHPLQK
jgi:hypothetical protein